MTNELDRFQVAGELELFVRAVDTFRCVVVADADGHSVEVAWPVKVWTTFPALGSRVRVQVSFDGPFESTV